MPADFASSHPSVHCTPPDSVTCGGSPWLSSVYVASCRTHAPHGVGTSQARGRTGKARQAHPVWQWPSTAQPGCAHQPAHVDTTTGSTVPHDQLVALNRGHNQIRRKAVRCWKATHMCVRACLRATHGRVSEWVHAMTRSPPCLASAQRSRSPHCRHRQRHRQCECCHYCCHSWLGLRPSRELWQRWVARRRARAQQAQQQTGRHLLPQWPPP